MDPFVLNPYATLVAASVTLLFGRWLTQRIPFLQNFNIPEPVTGGLMVAGILALAFLATGFNVHFETPLQTPFMLAFFASIGLGADIQTLRRGGKVLIWFICAVVALLIIQNIVGVGLALLLDQNPLIGLITGSITLSGGHGTGAAWSEIFVQNYHLVGARELAQASATFGLILGGLIGGPVAHTLIARISPDRMKETLPDAPLGFDDPDATQPTTVFSLIETFALVSLCLLIGMAAEEALRGTAFALPTFVCVLLVGVVLRNALSFSKWHKVCDQEVSLLGNFSLSLFLVTALMSLRLVELASLALPLITILAVQTVIMALFAMFVTFRIMGANYDAAVLAAGHCGFGLGATPTAIANMQAITHRYGPSHLAFLLVPLTGALFLDLLNAICIKAFLLLPFFPQP